MTPHVMKRDGCKVPFRSERIKEAILRAAKAAGVDDADYCATVAEVVSNQMNARLIENRIFIVNAKGRKAAYDARI
jgi:ribonucleoside-triphosphate reductase